jgi:hypothetical protein
VDFAIKFHNQTPLGAAEISDKWSDWMLAPKLQSRKLPSPQGIP